jgi:hypothetical protein
VSKKEFDAAVGSLKLGHRAMLNMMRGHVEEEVGKQLSNVVQAAMQNVTALQAMGSDPVPGGAGGTAGTMGLGSRIAGPRLMGLAPNAFNQSATSSFAGHGTARGM